MKKWVLTFGGLGLLPAMPGTFGSFAAAAIFYVLWLSVPGLVWPVVIVFGLLFSVLTVLFWPWAHEYFGKKDARQIVLDEVVGQWTALAFLPLAAGGGAMLPAVAVCFFLFRGFDVVKPFPIRAIERLPGGWGVLLDDVAGGIYAGLGFWALSLLTHLLVSPEAAAAVI